jgi:subtilase family serine protease
VSLRRVACLFTAAQLLAALSIVCYAQEQPLLTRHLRQLTPGEQAQYVRPLSPTKSMTLDIVLPLRNQADLSDLLRELYDPSSPLYRHFLSVEEFSSRYGPTQEHFDAVIRFARTNGFTVIGGSRAGMDVQVSGSVATVESAFKLTIAVYQHPTENPDVLRAGSRANSKPALPAVAHFWFGQLFNPASRRAA